MICGGLFTQGCAGNGVVGNWGTILHGMAIQ
jgi:hypothetical protein